MTALTSQDELRSQFRRPNKTVRDKQLDHLDGHCRDFIAHSPFVVISTADASGRCDASPRGGPPGFVRVLDDGRLSLPDLSGNNRLDSFGNIVENPWIGMLFLVPGVGETLRVNGRATVERSDDDGTVSVVVDVTEAFLHCAKAFRRSGLWDPASWPDTSGMARPARMLRDQVAPDLAVDEIEHYLEQDYAETLWDPSRTVD